MNPATLLTRFTPFVVLVAVLHAAEASPAREPTNAAETTAKKVAADLATSEAFHKWKAQLGPAQQAWETTLEQNLGSFYLPISQRDKLNAQIAELESAMGKPAAAAAPKTVRRGRPPKAAAEAAPVAEKVKAPRKPKAVAAPAPSKDPLASL